MIGLKHCLGAGSVCVCVVEQAEPPCICSRLVMMRTGAVQTRAPREAGGPDRGAMQEVSQMKYDLNVHGEMGKITLGVYGVSPRPQDTGAHYARALTYLGKSQCLSSRTLSPAVTYALILRRPRCCSPAELIIAA